MHGRSAQSSVHYAANAAFRRLPEVGAGKSPDTSHRHALIILPPSKQERTGRPERTKDKAPDALATGASVLVGRVGFEPTTIGLRA